MYYKMYLNGTLYMTLKCYNKINIFCLLAQLMQLQKSHTDHTTLLDNVNTSSLSCLHGDLQAPLQEKRKVRKALEMRKNVELKMESYQQRYIIHREINIYHEYNRSALLQEELVSLRSQLKSTKKKFKVYIYSTCCHVDSC